MTDETGSSQGGAGRGSSRGRGRRPRRGGRGFRGRGRRPAASAPSTGPASAELATGADAQDEQQHVEAAAGATPEEVEGTGEGSAQEEVRQEIAGADVDEPSARPAESRPYRPERPPQRFQARPPRQPHPDQQAARQHGSAIHEAIQDVEHIVNDLREALEEMEEVLETLELAEREKTADERELEQLRRALKSLHRGRESGPRPQQYGQGQPRESREQRSWRGPENRDARSRRAESEGRPSEAAGPEPEQHRESVSGMDPRESEPPPEQGFEPPQPS